VDDSALKLKNYIEEISILQDKDNKDFKSLKNCLRNYAFSDDELEKLERLSLNHQSRSEELLKSKRLSEAIFSMERAVEINPFSDEFRNKIAQLYLMRANREGYKKADRDLAFEAASISISLNNDNPIARSLLKEIQKKDDRISGRIHNKYLGPLFLVIIVIALIAVFVEREYIIPLFNNYAMGKDEEWVKPEPIKTIQFTELEIEPQISSLNKDFIFNIDKSQIAKTNGSYSYTLQGEISAEKETIKSADLDINFVSTEGKTLFTKTVSLIKEDHLVLRGEKILLDQFFFIHYLPPDIAKVSLNMSNYSFSEEEISAEESLPVYIEWETSRPEGIKININLKNENAYESYSHSYKNFKIHLENLGLNEIHNLEVKLSWENIYGDLLFEDHQVLINKKNPPLLAGKDRLFYLFTEMPNEINNEKEKEFYISITGIN